VSNRHVLTLSCLNQPGIVHAVTSVLVDGGCDITEHQQFDDSVHGRLFLRTCFEAPSGTREQLEAAFATVAPTYGMRWQLHDASRRARVLVLASKFGHCLNDLLYRWQVGSLGVDIALIVSNHPDLGAMARAAGVPFLHLPVAPDTKEQAEATLLDMVEQHEIDLVVLARYMQVLSSDLCKKLEGRAINIHHSFLPSFKGAKPYHQAHARGVKLIGATAHYVTPDLDEGPIIEQDVARAEHSLTPDEMVAAGRDVEVQVLARALAWHTERRVLLDNNRTVVFR
jgi:formyltetrahydrofolate deformylase